MNSLNEEIRNWPLHHFVYAINIHQIHLVCTTESMLFRLAPRAILSVLWIVVVISDNRKFVGMLAMNILYKKQFKKKSQSHTHKKRIKFTLIWHFFQTHLRWFMIINEKRGQNDPFDLCNWHIEGAFCVKNSMKRWV